MLTIQPQYVSLTELLNGRLFVIPEYQRAYSWTSHQREDLFSDIEKVHAKGVDQGHFLAAVVCLRRDQIHLGTDVFHRLEVVDGQQRLTTLIILLNALKRALEMSRDDTEKGLAEELSKLLVKQPGEDLLLLQTNHDSSYYFAKFLRNGEAPSPDEATTLADKEILKAIQECTAFVERWRARHQDLVHLMALLKNRLFVLLHQVEDEKTVYTVFEVLNSRGLDVSWFDRLKSILMGIAFDLENADRDTLIKELHIIWRDIYNTIGLRQGLSRETLQFAATLRTATAPSRPLGEEAAVDALRREASDAGNLRDLGAYLLNVTKACDSILGNRRLAAVTRIAQARLLAVAISLRSELTPAERNSLLRVWEKVVFRIYGMMGKDARTSVGNFVRLAWRVANEKLPPDDIEAEIKQLGARYPITDAVNNLRGGNCYEGWEYEIRYFMFRYEEHLSWNQGQTFSDDQWNKIWESSPSNSIEHILPQSQAPVDDCHRLGNLVLLSPKLNSTLNDRDPEDKADAYSATGLLIAGKVADVIRHGPWDSAAIARREEELLNWAETEWAD